MPQLYVLYEHVSGCAVFRTTEFEEIGIFLPQVRQSVCDISKFRSIVFLVAFQPFENQKSTLENLKKIASDELSSDLQLFLENNIPRSKKSKQVVVLGVASTDLASAISEKLGINCVSSGVVKELLRGIRFHFPKLIKGFKEQSYLTQSQIATGHQFSRNKINFSRQDCMVMESSELIDELEKDIRNSARRIKGWYSEHFPELYNLMGDDARLYVTCVVTIGDRKNMPEDIEEQLNSFIRDSTKVKSILQAAHNSMGMDITFVDLQNIQMFCKRVLSLIEVKQKNLEHLKMKMKTTAPNMSSLVGELVGSKLICRAGGLNKLAVLPASTLQVLGADKKLFRTVAGKKEKDPICGLLSQSEIISKIHKRNKGRLSRMLANKCSLAVRVDCFKRASDKTFGSKLLQQVEKNVQMREKIKPVTNNTLTKETVKIIPGRKVNGYLDSSEEGSEMNDDTEKIKGKKRVADRPKQIFVNSHRKDTNSIEGKASKGESDDNSKNSELSGEDISDVKQVKKSVKKGKPCIGVKSKSTANNVTSDKEDTVEKVLIEESEEDSKDLEIPSISNVRQVKKTVAKGKKGVCVKRKSITNDITSCSEDTSCKTKKVLKEESEEASKNFELPSECISNIRQVIKVTTKGKKVVVMKGKNTASDVTSVRKVTSCEMEKALTEDSEEDSKDIELQSEDTSETERMEKTAGKRKSTMDESLLEDTDEEASVMQKRKITVMKKTPLKGRRKNICK